MDECFVGHARDECSDHVCIHDIRKLIALLGEVVDVLAQSLSCFLFAGFEILGISRVHVRALKVPYEDALEVCPQVDVVHREMFEPCSGAFHEVEWLVLDDEDIIVHPAYLTGEVEVF
jgi:hypothetical protein